MLTLACLLYCLVPCLFAVSLPLLLAYIAVTLTTHFGPKLPWLTICMPGLLPPVYLLLCAQLFLELQVNHPDWLQLFLVDAEPDVPPQPKRWAVETLTWVLETAGKRCARSLADYVAQMLRLHSIFSSAGAGAAPQQQSLPASAWADAAQALRAQQPPLAQAVMAFVERVAELIRDCVPTKRGASSGGGGGGGNLLPEIPEIPADAARVLLAYAQLGPWAAAHLMQVGGVMPKGFASCV
jgi:hypothetical protein